MKKSYPVDKFVVKAKLKAACLHFVCSVVIFALAVWWLVAVLYPSFHFGLNGGIYGLRLMAGVDLVLGPLLTLLVFHPVKPWREKMMDFIVIGAVQLAALGYGLHTMYQEHPKLLVYYQYGNAVTVTQRDWAAQPNEYPENLAQFSRLGGVPILEDIETTQQISYQPLSFSALEARDQYTRKILVYAEDKASLATLEKEHGRLYIMKVLGKYQGVYVALDKDLNVIALFGQREE